MKDNYHIRDTGRYSLGANLTGVENQTKHDYNQELGTFSETSTCTWHRRIVTSLHLVSSNWLFSPLKKIKLVKGHKELLVPMYGYFASRFSCNRTRNRGRRGITAGRERILCSLRCYLPSTLRFTFLSFLLCGFTRW